MFINRAYPQTHTYKTYIYTNDIYTHVKAYKSKQDKHHKHTCKHTHTQWDLHQGWLTGKNGCFLSPVALHAHEISGSSGGAEMRIFCRWNRTARKRFPQYRSQWTLLPCKANPSFKPCFISSVCSELKNSPSKSSSP